MKKNSKLAIILVFIVAGAMLFSGYFAINKKYRSRTAAREAQLAQEVQQQMVLNELKNEPVPEDLAPDISNNPSQLQPDPENIPAKYLLAMPFYSQAPGGNWDKTHEEMCEEASLLNAGLYLLDKELSGEEYDRELLKMKDLENRTVGAWESTTISQTQKISDAYFAGKIQSKIIGNPTISQIESEVSQGHPVIVPLAGREIGNPNYTPPGPIYHMLVIKGYDEKFFVTNDVGTRKGNSYVFKKETIMDKMHDWNEEDIHLGEKKLLVLYK